MGYIKYAQRDSIAPESKTFKFKTITGGVVNTVKQIRERRLSVGGEVRGEGHNTGPDARVVVDTIVESPTALEPLTEGLDNVPTFEGIGPAPEGNSRRAPPNHDEEKRYTYGRTPGARRHSTYGHTSGARKQSTYDSKSDARRRSTYRGTRGAPQGASRSDTYAPGESGNDTPEEHEGGDPGRNNNPRFHGSFVRKLAKNLKHLAFGHFFG